MVVLPTTLAYETVAIYEGSGAISFQLTVASGNTLVHWPSRPISRGARATTANYVSLQWGERFAKLVAKLDILERNENLTPAGCPAPDYRAVGLARIVLTRFHQIEAPPDKIVATADGGVAICFMDGDKYSDIECSNEGGLLGVTTNRRDRPTVWEIDQNPSGVDNACARIKNFIRGNTRQTL